MIDTTGLPELLLPHELAKFARTTTAKLAQDRYLRRGFPYTKSGNRILYPRDGVLKYLAEHTVEASA